MQALQKIQRQVQRQGSAQAPLRVEAPAVNRAVLSAAGEVDWPHMPQNPILGTQSTSGFRQRLYSPYK